MREEYRVEGMPEPLSHYTDAVRAGELLFISGVVPVDGEGRLVGGEDVVAQATAVFENLGRVSAAGAALGDVAKVTVSSQTWTTGPGSTRCGRRSSGTRVPPRRSSRSAGWPCPER